MNFSAVDKVVVVHSVRGDPLLHSSRVDESCAVGNGWTSLEEKFTERHRSAALIAIFSLCGNPLNNECTHRSWTGCWTTVGRLGPGLGVSERKPFAAIKDDQVPHEGERGQETEGHGALLQGCPAVVCGEDEGGDDEEQSDGRRVTEVQFSPAGDANSLVQWCGQQDEQKKSEEEGRAAHKLKEVQRDATDAAVYHLLLHEGHERQEHFKELDEEPGQVQDLGWDTETGRLWIWSRGRRIYTLRRHQSSGSVSVRSEINGAHFL